MAVSLQGATVFKGKLNTSPFGDRMKRRGDLSCKRWRFVSTKAALAEKAAATKSGSWTWKCDNKSVKINFVEKSSGAGGGNQTRSLLLLPTVSDVSTTEEWQAVSDEIVTKNASWRTVTVDWPGFGRSDSPALNYTADLMQNFLADFVNSPDGPLGSSATAPVIAGGGHAATIAIKAVAKGRLSAAGLVAVAPTWAGPLPIVFGQSPEAESRYGFLRSAIRAPAIGWALYSALVSSSGTIRKQYESHVYSDASNVTDRLVESRLALTRREGARYAPAAFLTGLLDPVKSREEFVQLFGDVETQGKQVPVLVLFSKGSPKRSRAEMEALRGAKGVSKFVEIPGALLPQEEFPDVVASELLEFLSSL